jgi:hypothetical protein
MGTRHCKEYVGNICLRCKVCTIGRFFFRNLLKSPCTICQRSIFFLLTRSMPLKVDSVCIRCRTYICFLAYEVTMWPTSLQIMCSSFCYNTDVHCILNFLVLFCMSCSWENRKTITLVNYQTCSGLATIEIVHTKTIGWSPDTLVSKVLCHISNGPCGHISRIITLSVPKYRSYRSF